MTATPAETTAAGWTSCSGLGQLQHRIQQTPDTITYKYDPGGRRIKKTVDGFSTQYLYDGGNVIADYDGNGNILRKYIYGPREGWQPQASPEKLAPEKAGSGNPVC